MVYREAKLLKYLAGSSLLVPLPKWARPETVLSLAARGCIAVNMIGNMASITDKGYVLLADYQDLCADRRWTRGLAIAAIILSSVSIVISLMTLWIER